VVLVVLVEGETELQHLLALVQRVAQILEVVVVDPEVIIHLIMEVPAVKV
jgi:hypothetical protein